MPLRPIVPGPGRVPWLCTARLAVFPLVWASLVFPPVTMAPTGTDWAVSFAAAAVSLAAVRCPLAVLFAQSALLAAVWTLPAPLGAGTVQLLVTLATVEVVVRRRGAVLGLGVATAGLVTMLNIARGTGFAPLPLITRMLLVIGGTVLVGALIRATRRTVRQAEERAREMERRREADTRAARAEERTAIARELHDLVAHHLSSIVLRIGVARHVGQRLTGSAAGTVLDEVHDNARVALSDLRQLVDVLRDPSRVGEGPAATPVGTDLCAALERIAERVRRTGLRVTARIDPAVGELDTMRRLAVLRLAQEGLTNALRHAAGATRVTLAVRCEPGAVRVEVTDDGTGATRTDPYDGGHGLAGMRERVDLVGGRFSAGPVSAGPVSGGPESSPPGSEPGGWRVVALLPAPGGTAIPDRAEAVPSGTAIPGGTAVPDRAEPAS